MANSGTTSVVTGDIELPGVVSAVGWRIVFTLNRVDTDGAQVIIPQQQVAIVQSDGTITISLWRTASGSANAWYDVTAVSPDSQTTVQVGQVDVPDAASANLNTLLNTFVSEGGFNPPFLTQAQAAVDAAEAAAAAAAASAASSESSAADAEASAADAAISAADAAISAADAEASALAAGAPIFADTVLGILGTSNDDLFYVPVNGALDIYQNDAGVAIYVDTLLNPNFAARTTLVAAVAAGYAPKSGKVLSDGTVSYIGSAGATDIPDLPGLLPFGDHNLFHFGAVGDGVADDTSSILAAIAATNEGENLIVDPGSYIISATINVTKAINFIIRQGAEVGDTGTPGSAPVATCFRWNSGTPGDVMMAWKSSVANKVISRGGIFGTLLLDGNNVATKGLVVSSAWYSEFDVITYRTVNNGFIIDDGNGALSNAIYIRRYEHFHGPNAAVVNCSPMLIDGDVTGNFCTNVVCDFFEAEVINGHALTFRGVDSCDFRRVKAVNRSGASTGFAVRFLKSVTNPIFHAQKNRIGMLISAGKIYFGDFTKNNIIDNCIAESGSVVYESAGSDKRTNHIGRIVDFRNSATWQTKQFLMNDQKVLPISGFSGYGTSATAGTIGGLVAGRAWIFSASATTGISLSDIMPDDWDDGFVRAIRLTLQSIGSATGDGVFKIQYVARAIGAAVGGFTVTETETLTPAQNVGSTTSAHEIAFTSPQAVSRGGIFALTIERLGADGADTFPNSLALVGVEAVYYAKGPDSAGTYGPYAEFLIGGSDVNP